MAVRDSSLGSEDKQRPDKVIDELHRFARFLGAGMVSAIASVGLFVIYFRVFGIHYMAANVMVFFSWVWFGFELQRRWAFKTERTRKGFSRYATNQVTFVVIGSGLLWTFVEVVKLRAELAFVVSLGIVTICMYIASRLWVFRLGKDNLQQVPGKSIL